jgi:hypothetical protein
MTRRRPLVNSQLILTVKPPSYTLQIWAVANGPNRSLSSLACRTTGISGSVSSCHRCWFARMGSRPKRSWLERGVTAPRNWPASSTRPCASWNSPTPRLSGSRNRHCREAAKAKCASAGGSTGIPCPPVTRIFRRTGRREDGEIARLHHGSAEADRACSGCGRDVYERPDRPRTRSTDGQALACLAAFLIESKATDA